MDWNLALYMFLISVSQSVLAFNIDPNPWKDFTQPQNIAFGYKVIQRDRDSVIVSDPLLQSQNQRGKVYMCAVSNGQCSPMQINVPPEVVNMSLGLSMTKDRKSSNVVVCGPTIPKDCKQFTSYNGMCFKLGSNSPIPRTLRDCPTRTDIAFLLDGSGSVSQSDFTIMKNFVISMINEFKDRDFQFAVAQYSLNSVIHVQFNTFSSTEQIHKIRQVRGGAYTASAINKVVNEVFTTRAGARENVNRVLVVITDGQSNDTNLLPDAVRNAERKNIIRYAVGVGNAFQTNAAEQELNTIASDPDNKHVFKVNDFSVLKEIQKTLEANIIAIEGTQASGDSTRMEFAQDGFTADFDENSDMIMSAVGAFQWKGGYQKYSSTRGTPLNSFQKGNGNESYLGYSMAVAQTFKQFYIIQGAPRDKHMGAVIIYNGDNVFQALDPPEPQIGAYYGAELCVVDLNLDNITDLLLVSAPMYNEKDQEGKVFIYTFPGYFGSQLQYIGAVKGISGQRGRFGLTLASPADLNEDSLVDVVVGAPLEENYQGSIYIFNGRNEDIAPTFSQRITGSSVRNGLQFFGISLSPSALDLSKDQLPDLAVGSKGAVLLLRSRPIVDLQNTVTFIPSKIPTKDFDCNKTLTNTVKLCFKMTRRNNDKQDLSAKINYTLTLDAKRPSYRAYFSEIKRILTDTIDVLLQEKCKEHVFSLEACPNDALNPVINELKYTFEGLPLNQQDNLRPILRPNTKTTSDYNLDFEINCGTDNICIDNLKVDFNFSGYSVIQVGIMQELNVTVSIVNRGENSYNSRVILKYPFGLSFRRSGTKEGRVECESVDSDGKATLGTTTCLISKPIFKTNGLAIFDVTYGINRESNFDRMMKFTASASSDNDKHSPNNELFREKNIDVKYAIYVSMTRHENSTIHINFTAGQNNLERPVHQIFKVENFLRDLSFNIFIRVPIKLGVKDIWTNNYLEIQGCSADKDEQPTVQDFVAALKKQPEVNCSVAVCRVFKCAANLIKNQAIYYSISGHVSSGLLEQIGLISAIFELISTATLDYNETTYIYSPSGSINTAPIGKINTQVELYGEKFPLKEVIGGGVGGIVLLAVITAALYKTGFFKSKYKTMLEEARAAARDGGTGDSLVAE
ncbi:integrin alpha-M-like isoform X2 [Tachysurus fulvidraco]|uniref:integrin alpha-M-like isoform X1 n=1 Tax=Tachysurus fulvidraco TaxID=1234273 RepID=UPI001FEE3FBF|nr:integrin alpha-M-like isoform X1 [Tachysurus fulvidraco]XP_047673065.1 integrin alpha-M-like isoform X2 [Tachysurus fulvidraco]